MPQLWYLPAQMSRLKPKEHIVFEIYRVPGKRVDRMLKTQEILNKTLAFCRTRLNRTWHNPKTRGNVRYFFFHWNHFIFTSVLDVKKCVKVDPIFYVDFHRKRSRTSHFRVQKIKCKCLRVLEASIGTIATFTRSSDSSSVSITTQTMPAELAERLHRDVVALPTLRPPSNWLSSLSNGLSCCLNLLWKWCWFIWKLWAPLSTCTWLFTHCSTLCDNFSDTKLYVIKKWANFYAFF